MLISEQVTGPGAVTELGWRFNPAEHRNEHGEWMRGAGDVLSGGADGTGEYKAPPADRVNVAGLKGSEHPFIEKYGLSSKNIVAAYDAATPDERAQGARWYSDAHDVAKAIGNGDADKGAAMLSAFSVQTDWATDVMNAASTLANGKVPVHGVGITGAVRQRAQDILDAKTHEDIDKLFPKAGSAKTRNFYHLILNGGDRPGDTEGHVVIDRHALSVAAGRRLTSQETAAPTYAEMAEQHPGWTHEQMKAYRATFPADPTGSIYSYQHIADMYRAAALEISRRDGTKISPHQLQAVTWLHQLHVNDAEDSHLIELAADAAAHGGKMSSVPGAVTAKGRASAMSRRWAAWASYARAHQIPVHSGTTALATVAGQVRAVELSWRDSWMHEMRGSHGEWTAVGNPATAGHVVTLVPGRSTSGDWAGNLKREMDSHLAGDTAVVTYHGGSPEGLAALQSKIHGGNPQAHLTVAGHGEGATTAARAAKDHGMPRHDLVLLGSPGVPARHASELGDPEHVWAGTASSDPVRHVSMMHLAGTDPTSRRFGARVIGAESAWDTGHRSYTERDSEALEHLAEIGVGKASHYTSAGKTPDPDEGPAPRGRDQGEIHPLDRTGPIDKAMLNPWVQPHARAMPARIGFKSTRVGSFSTVSGQVRAVELGHDAWRHEARDTHGRWTHGAGGLRTFHGHESRGNLGRFEGRDELVPGMDAAAGRKALDLPGRPDGAGTPGDPIDVQGDMPRAVQLMAAGKHVRLNGAGELPALESEINRQADAVLKSTGAEPPWDLGYVSVKGTRLFNEQTLGIPRIDMPQLSGPAQPGSEAAILAHGANKFIELDPEFRQQLKDDGVDVKDERARTDTLRATQTQLTAASVAGIARAAQQGNPKVLKMLKEPIWVSADNYVIDGHHRWAAHAIMGDKEMNIQRIGLPAALAIPYAEGFAQRMGIAGVDIGNSKLVQGANTVTSQVVALSGWHDAWRHELRGRHGEWVRSGEAVQGLVGEKYPGELSEQIRRAWRGETDPSARDALNKASASLDAEDTKTAAAMMHKAQAYASLAGAKDRASIYSDLADRLLHAATGDPATAKLLGQFMNKADDTVPAMLGGDVTLDWDGKTPSIYPDTAHPDYLAYIDWHGHMDFSETAAGELRNAVTGDKPIEHPDALLTPLHELIHAVLPAGQKRAGNGDRQAYQKKPYQAIEEGFTELGATNHAEEFFDQLGIGSRETGVWGGMVIRADDPNYAAKANRHLTMAEYAREMADPDKILKGDSWGHYNNWTADAYKWTAKISRNMHGAVSPQDLSDQISSVGTAAKPRVMAQQLLDSTGIGSLPDEKMSQLLDAAEAQILASWGKKAADDVAASAAASMREKVAAMLGEAA